MPGEANLKVLLSLKDEMSGGLKEAGKSAGGFSGVLKGLGIGIAAVGTAAVGAGVAAVTSFANAGDEIQKMALRTGFSTEALSELKYAAELSGASLSTVETGIRGMANFLQMVDQNSLAAVDSMNKLGLSVEDIQGLSPEETFQLFS